MLGYEIEVNGERYVIVSQNAILLVVRNDLTELDIGIDGI